MRAGCYWLAEIAGLSDGFPISPCLEEPRVSVVIEERQIESRARNTGRNRLGGGERCGSGTVGFRAGSRNELKFGESFGTILFPPATVIEIESTQLVGTDYRGWGRSVTGASLPFRFVSSLFPMEPDLYPEVQAWINSVRAS